MNKNLFVLFRKVAFCETDAMGVVHHANYLRYFEEARVAWLRERGLMNYHFPYAPVCFAVLESHCYHEKGPRFDDDLKIAVTVRREGLKIRFRYAIYSQTGEQRIATGETLLVPVDEKIKPVRLKKEFMAQLENESWIETWPLSL
ncbi:MAG: acyl-CoA thioesterase [Bdellovibrionales bacterium]|nr:acyl-CoA thioesterase [Bdellovibrionales bacterium]